MTSPRARRMARWLPVLALVAGVAAGVPGSQAAPGGTLTVTPAQAAPGEPLRFAGSLPTAVRRPIVVERGMNGGWIDLGTRHTNARGAFSFSMPKNGMPSDPYRILAPRVTIRGRTYPSLATPVRTIGTIEPEVEASLSAGTIAAGRTVTLSVDAVPARPGRPLTLERRVSPTTWVAVPQPTVVTEDQYGEASFPIPTTTVGITVYRVVAATWNGAGWYPSFPVILDVTAGRAR